MVHCALALAQLASWLAELHYVALPSGLDRAGCRGGAGQLTAVFHEPAVSPGQDLRPPTLPGSVGQQSRGKIARVSTASEFS